MLNFWCVITALWSLRRMSLILGNGYWSSGQGGEMCHTHTYEPSAKWKWSVCVHAGDHFIVTMFSKWKVWRRKVCDKRGVPFQLSGRKRRGIAAGGSNRVAQGKHFDSVTWLLTLPTPPPPHTSLPPLVPRKHSNLTSPRLPAPMAWLSESSTKCLRSSSDGTSPGGRPPPGRARIIPEAS